MNLWKAHNYQLIAKGFQLAHPFSGLFLDPGLGKTSISLSTILTLIKAHKTKGVLLIAPLEVIYNVWPEEIKKWTNFNGLSHTILHGPEKDYGLHLNRDIYLINPEGLPWLLKTLSEYAKKYKSVPFDTLLIDESTKFKAHDAETRFKIVQVLMPLFKRRHIMTGTPAPTALLNLWAQIFILDGGKALGKNYYHFRNKYFYTESWNKHRWLPKDGSREEIYRRISHLVLNMKAEDHLDMPDLLFCERLVYLNDHEMKQYKKLETELFLAIDEGEITVLTEANKYLKCHQAANGKVYEDIPDDLTDDEIKQFKKTRKALTIHTRKIDSLLNLIDELNGKPVLIAYNYKHDLDALLKALGNNTPYIGSGVSTKNKKKILAQWNAGELPYLLCHPQTMAHGLNMQSVEASICWYSLPNSLELYLQLIARLYRQGYKGKDVRVYLLIAKRTMDEVILKRLRDNDQEQLSLRQALTDYRRGLLK